MPFALIALVLLSVAYLVGAIPFGYLAGRLRGVDLFQVGSGNIGATNVARVLGPRIGLLVLILDLLKGVIPCALIVPIARLFDPLPDEAANWLLVGAAAFAFLGHLFPIYLGFRGGKGVATGAGTILVLVPGPALLAILSWIVMLLSTRIVSLGSLAAAVLLVSIRLLTRSAPFSPLERPVTLYLLAGTLLVIIKHRGNISRLLRGTENQIADFPMRHTFQRVIYLVAMGFWFGGAGFFNFVAAPAIFSSFKDVVYAGNSDRTAQQTIIAPDAPVASKDALASALAGAAVGPIFVLYFRMQAICGVAALVVAWSWRHVPGRVHRIRLVIVSLALSTVLVGWPLSDVVSELRLLRYSPDPATAAAAKTHFAITHLVSLFLSMITVVLAGIGLSLGAVLPAATVSPIVEIDPKRVTASEANSTNGPERDSAITRDD